MYKHLNPFYTEQDELIEAKTSRPDMDSSWEDHAKIHSASHHGKMEHKHFEARDWHGSAKDALDEYLRGNPYKKLKDPVVEKAHAQLVQLHKHHKDREIFHHKMAMKHGQLADKFSRADYEE